MLANNETDKRIRPQIMKIGKFMTPTDRSLLNDNKLNNIMIGLSESSPKSE